MTREYDNTNRGALFPNDRKERDTHADWRGSINVDGVEYWVDCWDGESSKGPIRKLSVRKKEARSERSASTSTRGSAPHQSSARPSSLAPAHRAPVDLFDDDDIPF